MTALHGRRDEGRGARPHAPLPDGRRSPAEAELWTITLGVIATISLVWGNLGALVQRNVKRMLAYSSISHAGFLLMPIAAGNELGGRALLFYLIPYAALSVGAFAVVAARERELGGRKVTIEDMAGFGWERPLYGAAMATFMIGFIGLPPTGLFVGKFYAFSALYERGWIWLMVLGAVFTAVSIYYYLGLVRSMYMRAGDRRRRRGRRLASARHCARARDRRLARRRRRHLLRGRPLIECA